MTWKLTRGSANDHPIKEKINAIRDRNMGIETCDLSTASRGLYTLALSLMRTLEKRR